MPTSALICLSRDDVPIACTAGPIVGHWEILAGMMLDVENITVLYEGEGLLVGESSTLLGQMRPAICVLSKRMIDLPPGT